MPPKRHQPQQPDPNQPAFIEVEVSGSGLTDPENHRRIAKVVGIRPEGVLPQEAEVGEGMVTPEAAATSALAEATKTEHRRRAQLGKHSPLQRDGSYLAIRLGDVLPPDESLGRGERLIVKERNYEDAKRYAAKLESKRLEHLRRNPTLDTIQVTDAIQVVADGFDLDSALEAAQGLPKPASEPKADELPRFNTLSRRLRVIIDEAERAKLVPGSRTEITVAMSLLDHPEGASQEHLDETYNATKNIVARKGYPEDVRNWYAKRAFMSRCYELVDFYADAVESGAAVHDFVEIMKQFDTDEARREFVANTYHPAMGVIVRHIVAHQLKDGDMTEEDLFFKPMSTGEKRLYQVKELPTTQTRVGGTPLSKADLLESKRLITQRVRNGTGEYTDWHKTRRNKTLVTPFTNPDMPEDVQKFIHDTFTGLTMDELRQIIPVVATKQWRREQLWRGALDGVQDKEARKLIDREVASVSSHTLQ